MNGQHPMVAPTSEVTRLLDAAGEAAGDRQPCLIKVSSVLSDPVFSVGFMDGQHPAVAVTSQVTRLLDAAGEAAGDRQAGLIKAGSGSVGGGV